MSIYRGFNTIDRDHGPYHLTDASLVIRDFLNSLAIRKGEKLMYPNFGTVIWHSLWEPLTPALKDTIREDVERMVAYEPRFKKLENIVVEEYDNGLKLVLTLRFTDTDQTTELALQFDRRSNTIVSAGL
jgi:phage baseplate assembly protein W